MQGEIDSMNVSVAAGILIFEAKRQRNFEWSVIAKSFYDEAITQNKKIY
jgi:hypothetical protein